MSILVDREIIQAVQQKKLIIEPFSESQVQPNSYDVRLSEHFAWYDRNLNDPIDPFDAETVNKGLTKKRGSVFVIWPGQFVLASTLETIQLPNDIVGQVNGKSSLARLGLLVHTTAGWVDSGFAGDITLELCNLGSRPIQLTAGMPIAQLVFTKTNPCDNSYAQRKSAKYQGQVGATESRYYLNKRP